MLGYSRLDVLDSEINKVTRSLSTSKIRQRIRSERIANQPESNESSIAKINRHKNKTSSSSPMKLALQMQQQQKIQTLFQSVAQLHQHVNHAREEIKSLEFRLGETPVTVLNLPDILETALKSRMKRIHIEMEKRLDRLESTTFSKIDSLNDKLDSITEQSVGKKNQNSNDEIEDDYQNDPDDVQEDDYEDDHEEDYRYKPKQSTRSHHQKKKKTKKKRQEHVEDTDKEIDEEKDSNNNNNYNNNYNKNNNNNVNNNYVNKETKEKEKQID